MSNGILRTSGKDVVDADGNVVLLRGVSLFFVPRMAKVLHIHTRVLIVSFARLLWGAGC